MALLARDFTLGRGPTAVITAVFAALLIAGRWLSELPDASAVLLAVAPFLALLAERGPLASPARLLGPLARPALASLAAVPALLWAWLQKPGTGYP
jgi:hypothetical protein